MFLVILLPLFIYFLDLGSFIVLIEIAGGIFIGLEGILILAMWGKMRKEAGIMINEFGKGLIKRMPNVFIYGLYTVFGVSIIYVIFEKFIYHFI